MKTELNQTKSSISRKKSKENSKKLRIYLKILINYLQSLSIINYFQMNWPYEVSSFLTSFSNISMTPNAISLGCLLQNYEIKYNTLYIETLTFLLTPYLINLMAIFLLILAYFRTKRSQITKFISMSVALNTFLQPAIIKKFIENIVCEKIEEKCYLITNMDIDFYAEFHQKWVNNFY